MKVDVNYIEPLKKIPIKPLREVNLGVARAFHGLWKIPFKKGQTDSTTYDPFNAKISDFSSWTQYVWPQCVVTKRDDECPQTFAVRMPQDIAESHFGK